MAKKFSGIIPEGLRSVVHNIFRPDNLDRVEKINDIQLAILQFVQAQPYEQISEDSIRVKLGSAFTEIEPSQEKAYKMIAEALDNLVKNKNLELVPVDKIPKFEEFPEQEERDLQDLKKSGSKFYRLPRKNDY